MEKLKPANVKGSAPKTVAPTRGAAPARPGVPAPSAPVHVPPLFRGIDWLTLAITFVVVGAAYFLTLAPEVTLEDSGELCTGSFYAGIPHPPGYPFWAIYSWLWTVLLPVGNVAWRVEVGEATAAAMACGLVAFMVSRGSSMLLEGIEELRTVTGRWESAICMVSGTTAGLLLGFNGVMWSESVAINRISLFGVPWVMIVVLCLLRWIYAPHQRRYLYCAMFFFGICATIHQTLLVAAMGIEVAIAATQPRLGRNFFLGNSILYVVGLLWKSTHFFTMLDTAPMVLAIYHAVGLGSIAAYAWFSLRTGERFEEYCEDAALAAFVVLAASIPSLGFLGVLLSLGALAAFVKLAWNTRKAGLDWVVVIVCGLLWVLGASFYFYEPIAGMTNPPMQWGYPRTVEGFFHALSRGQYEKASPTDLFGDPGRFIMQLGMLIGGVAEEYNWVLVFVALLPLLFLPKMQKRERAWIIGLAAIYVCIGVLLTILMNPPPDRAAQDLMRVFFASSHALIAILIGYGLALIAAYMATHYARFRTLGLVFGAVALFPACASFYSSLTALFGGGGVLNALEIFILMVLVVVCLVAAFHLYANQVPVPGEGRSSSLALLAAVLALAFLGWAAYFAFVSGDRPVALSRLWSFIGQCLTNKYQYGLPVYAGLLLLGSLLAYLGALLAYRQRAPLAITLGLFTLLPLFSGLCHWAGSEQRNHWFGYWFGHDMFTSSFKDKSGQPLYPDMAKDAILYGGTDPGRFCPTYMIFCESFIPHSCQPPAPAGDQNFDRRDVYLITQNALADGTYLCYLRAQYNRSKQIDPPFFSELARTILKDKDYETNVVARLLLPLDRFFTDLGARVERQRRTSTSWFTERDFPNLSDFAAKLRPSDKQDPVSQWLFQNLSPEAQDLVKRPSDSSAVRRVLARDLNRLLERELKARNQLLAAAREKEEVSQRISDGNTSASLKRQDEQLGREIAEWSKVQPLYDAQRFQGVKLSDYLQKFIAQDPQSDTRIRLNRLLLEAAYPGDLAKSLGGVYPDREIYMATPDDSQRCFQDYLKDAQRRAKHDQDSPNEPRQLKPGEDVRIVNDGGQERVQVSGQVAVMSINGLLTKVIFEQNPDNEFYVEESFPLDWMYPYLTPFCDIMKINRQPVPELTEDIVRRDHEFWCQNSGRLIGNWITYDTTIKEIVDFIEKTYLRRNFAGFQGDRAFIRDDQAQKSFSKLRSSVGGIYSWRIGAAKSVPEQQRMIKEADFAFKQAFAFCPYSPEAVVRYVQLLVSPALNRFDDALLIAQTCLRLDPNNAQVIGMVQSLKQVKEQHAGVRPPQSALQDMEIEVKSHPTDFQSAFNLAMSYMSLQQTNRAVEILEQVVTNPQVNINALLTVAQAYAQLGNYPRLEQLLKRATTMAPGQPEVWYDFAALEAMLGKNATALPALRQTLELNAKRLAADPKARNLTNQVLGDARFNPLHSLPEFQHLLQTNK